MKPDLRRRRAIATLAICALLGASAPARADETPTADELATRAKIASGTDRRPDAEREIWAVHVAGLDGTVETERRGNDVVTSTDLGPFRTARGSYHGEKWHQNENGQTLVEHSEPSQSERLLTQVVLRVHEPIEAWEVVTTYASGHVVRTFYSPRTDEVVRVEHVSAGHETHTTYDDFRTDAHGRTRPWHYFGGDERPDNDFDYRLVRDDVDADITDADLEIPHDRRTLVEFPAGTEPVRLPARIVNGRIYVRVTIAGRGLDFLLDTGAASLTINDTVARDLGLTVYGKTSQTVAGTFTTGRVVVPELAIGPLALHDVVMHTVPFSASETKSVRVVGLLGYDFISAVALKIDYGDGAIDASKPGTLVAPPGSGALDIRLNSGAPVARATIGNATGDDFIIDTGAAFSYVIFQRFARAHPEALEVEPRESYGSGVGGTFGYRTIETKRVLIGTWSFDDAFGVEALSANAFGFDNEDGLIGADILKRFTVYLDYSNDRLFLDPPARSGVESTTARPDR